MRSQIWQSKHFKKIFYTVYFTSVALLIIGIWSTPKPPSTPTKSP